MFLKDTPIRRKLMTIILLTCGAVLLLTCTAFFAYEYFTFRQTSVRNLSTLGKVIATNSTAALAFEDEDDAKEILSALKAESHIVAAILYDKTGKLFSKYPESVSMDTIPTGPGAEGFRFDYSHLTGFQPVMQGEKRLGTLYLKSDTGAMVERFRLYGGIVALVIVASFLLAYALSKGLQKEISLPILALAETAKAISDRRDYSVRARKIGQHELGLLTDAFNHMLTQIDEQNQALSESRDRVRSILNSALSAVVVMDATGKISDWNSRAEVMFGLPREEAIGRDLAEAVIPPRYREAHRLGLERYLANGEGSVLNRLIELSALRSDGSEFPVELSITPLISGGVVTFCGFVTDITERKVAEAEIFQLNAELEQRVLQRTAELEAANKELEAFSYSVSHDLRAPLRAVDGYSQAVLEDYVQILPAEGGRYLQTIREAAQRMGMLIDDLLTFSRLSRAPLNKVSVNTANLVSKVIDDLNPQRDGRQIDLRIGDLPTCVGDPALLKQVWINLLSNAFKYSQKREVAVVEIGCELTPEDKVYFVRDNGTGFDMRYADKLFGVFQRLHRSEEYDGTGVGLALVQRIIHRHAGRIWADAAVDRGASFYFTLPHDSNHE